jgi:hypothetical protein
LIVLYPGITDAVEKTIRDAKLGSIPLRQFKTFKDHLLGIDVLLNMRKDLDEVQRREVVDIIWGKGDVVRATRKFLSEAANGSKSEGWGLASWFSKGDPMSMDRQYANECQQLTNNTPDAEFLAALQDMVQRDPYLLAAVNETTKCALTSLSGTINKLVKTLNAKTAFIQQEECKKHIQRNASMSEENDLKDLRVGLIQQINKFSQSPPFRYVPIM